MSNSASPVRHAFSPVKRGRDIFIGAVRGFYRVSALCRPHGSGAAGSMLEPGAAAADAAVADAAAADAAAAQASSSTVAPPALAEDAARAATVARSAPPSLLATPPATSLRTPEPITPKTATPSLPKRKRARLDEDEVADAEAGVVATSTGCRGAVVKMPEFSPYKGVQDDLEAWRSETASSVGAGMSMLVIG